MMATSTKIKTRILIISDTHGAGPWPKKHDGSPDTGDELDTEDPRRTATGYRAPLPEADVVLHCGDLTKYSTLREYEQTFAMLRAIRAPLKLVIAGNHDLALDESYRWNQRGVDKSYPQSVRAVIDRAGVDGVTYLTEGVHSFDLRNGARLKVFASPYTPAYGMWAFQYPRMHIFPIPPGVDVAMTHGPPLGVFDLTANNERAGCEWLFQAVQNAKPKIHCFGHIHEAWGAYLAKWKEGGSRPARVDSAIDADGSRLVTELAAVVPSSSDDPEVAREKAAALKAMSSQRGFRVNLTEGDLALKEGEKTLFVNAAIMSVRYRPVQLPWIVDVDLSPAEA